MPRQATTSSSAYTPLSQSSSPPSTPTQPCTEAGLAPLVCDIRCIKLSTFAQEKLVEKLERDFEKLKDDQAALKKDNVELKKENQKLRRQYEIVGSHVDCIKDENKVMVEESREDLTVLMEQVNKALDVMIEYVRNVDERLKSVEKGLEVVPEMDLHRGECGSQEGTEHN